MRRLPAPAGALVAAFLGPAESFAARVVAPWLVDLGSATVPLTLRGAEVVPLVDDADESHDPFALLAAALARRPELARVRLSVGRAMRLDWLQPRQVAVLEAGLARAQRLRRALLQQQQQQQQGGQEASELPGVKFELSLSIGEAVALGGSGHEDGQEDDEVRACGEALLRLAPAVVELRVSAELVAHLAPLLEGNTVLEELSLDYASLAPPHQQPDPGQEQGQEQGELPVHKQLAAAVRACPGLRRLSLRGARIGAAGGAALVRALCEESEEQLVGTTGHKCKLEAVDLALNACGPSCGAALTKLLLAGPGQALARLDLSFNALGPIGGASLLQAAAGHQALRCVGLSRNELGDGVGPALAALVERNGVLEELELAYNLLSDATAQLLAAPLQANTVLVRLDLSGNKLGRIGGAALAEALAADTGGLRHVDLDNNSLGQSGLAFARALASNSTLRSLSLAGNRLSPAANLRFAEALRVNSTLEALVLKGGVSTKATRDRLAAVLAG